MKTFTAIASILSALPLLAAARDYLHLYTEQNYKGNVATLDPVDLFQTPCVKIPDAFNNQLRSAKFEGGGFWCRVFDDEGCNHMLTDIERDMPTFAPGVDKKITAVRCTRD